MRFTLVSLVPLALLSCDDVILAPAETTHGDCHGPVIADPATVVWRDSVWLYQWQTHRGWGAYSDVLLELSDRARWLMAAELTNWGSVPIRSPFLRVARAEVADAGVVVVGPAVDDGSELAPGRAILWADGTGIPIPAGWVLNTFVPELPGGAKYAVTLWWMECI